MTEREKEILGLIERDPMISQEALAEKLGIQRSSVAVHISNLMKKGYIKGKGYIVDTAPYVVVIGGSNMDIIGSPDGPLIPRDSNIGIVETRAGGVGRNIAWFMASLGIPIHFISALGQDDFGNKIWDDLNLKGIQTTGVMRHPNERTSTYLCINDQSGDMSVAISQMKIVERIDPNYLKQWHQDLEGAKLIVLDANLSLEALTYLLNTYAHKAIYIDPVSTAKSKKLKGLLDKVSFIKPNLLEASILTSLERFENESDFDYGDRMTTAMLNQGLKEVCISLGGDGVIHGDGDEITHYPVKTVKVVNTTGAGDAFFAGYCYGAFHNKSKSLCVETALRCASHQISLPHVDLSEEVLKA